MIDNRELRIGNWVNKGTRAILVQSIDDTCINVGFDSGYYRDLEGIPLTPEILEKAGFVFVNSQNRYGWYLPVDHRELCWCHSELISLEFKEGQFNEFNDTLFDFPCKYLHQLQNLIFCLTGEELEINL